MAIKQAGSQSYSFGFKDTSAQAIAAVIGVVPQTIDMDTEPEVEAQGKDIHNRTVAYAIDTNGQRTFTLNGYLTNKTLFDASLGAAFTYDGKVFFVSKKGEKQASAEFKMVTISGLSFPEITSTASTEIVA